MKTLYFIFFFLLSFSMVNAQTMPAKKFWAGPTVGLNRTGMIGGKVINYSGYETGYNLGGKFKYELGKQFNLNGYLLYSERRIDIDENYGIYQHYKYLDIPLTASYEFGNGNIKFYPMMGLHNAFLLQGKAIDIDPDNNERTITYDFYDDYPDDIKFFRYHIGYTAGIGNEFELSNKLRLFLEARYTRSFIGSFTNGNEITWFDNFEKNANFGDQEFFSFNVGVLF